jgi:hypothetical protein
MGKRCAVHGARAVDRRAGDEPEPAVVRRWARSARPPGEAHALQFSAGHSAREITMAENTNKTSKQDQRQGNDKPEKDGAQTIVGNPDRGRQGQDQGKQPGKAPDKLIDDEDLDLDDLEDDEEDTITR